MKAFNKITIVKHIADLPPKAIREYKENFGTRLIEDNRMDYYLFYKGTFLVAFMCGFWDEFESKGFYYVDHFYIVTSHQGKGYGRAIMDWICEHFRKVVLAPACGVDGFYKKLGFEYPKHNRVEMRKIYEITE